MYSKYFKLHYLSIKYNSMKSKALIIELIEQISQFENDTAHLEKDLNIHDFIGFLNSKHNSSNVKTLELQGGENSEINQSQEGPATDISILIVLMFRYAKGYIRKALKTSKIKSADEFAFLITLLTYKSLTKTELIQKQVMEKTSGTEIINRMIKLGLMTQFEDELDKRSVRIKVTESGKMEIYSILPEMQKVSKIVTGNLTENEKNTLAYLLRKLDNFHNDIFLNNKDAELNSLL